MPQIDHTVAHPTRAGSRPSVGLHAEVTDADIPKGLILSDGRIAATAHLMLEVLGFSPDDDLRGLAFASLWHHLERPAALDALRRARNGEETEVRLDLGYIHDEEGCCTVALQPAGAAGLVLMTLRSVPMSGQRPASG